MAEDLKEYVTASQFYRRAYTINPDSYEIYLGLVRAALVGETVLPTESLPAAPRNLSGKQNLALGLLFASNGAYAEAIPRFEEALHQDATSESATVNLALAYKNVGKPAAAIDLVQQTLQDTPQQNFTAFSQVSTKSRDNTSRLSKATSAPWNSILTMSSITSTWAWNISPTSPLSRQPRFTALARRSSPNLPGNF